MSAGYAVAATVDLVPDDEMAAKKKTEAVPRGGAGASPSDAYYAQNDQHPLRVRVPQATLAKLDELVELTTEKTKVAAVISAIDLAHKERVARKK